RNCVDILGTDLRSRHPSQDLPDITNVGGYYGEITCQGFFDRGRGAFPIRAEKHRVGRAVVPWHFTVLYTKHRHKLHVYTLCRNAFDSSFCQIVPLFRACWMEWE